MDRIRLKQLKSKIKTASEAAALFEDGMVVSMSGFTPSGYPKVVPLAIADRVKQGERLKFHLQTGASVGEEVDELWSSEDMILSRLPYQTNRELRRSINNNQTKYMDLHLSHVAQLIQQGVLRRPDIAILEIIGITKEGGLIPSIGIGNAPIFAKKSEKIILELNTSMPEEIGKMMDIYNVDTPPHRGAIPIYNVNDRIGIPHINCDLNKIEAIVLSDKRDSTRTLKAVDSVTQSISKKIIDFLEKEVDCGRIPEVLPPLQSGVGSIANSIFAGLEQSNFSNITCYTEVIQDSMLELIKKGTISYASSTAISPSPEMFLQFKSDIHFYKEKIILRPQEISNNPEVIRRLGVIAINAALEFDIYGNVNSTHAGGTKIINGIGGSGDFTRNARLNIFAVPSMTKNGRHSSIVPFVSHVDHTEHDTMILVTECGLADLRGLSPRQRAIEIIENCAHPNYRDRLMDYFEKACAKVGGNTPHLLVEAMKWHEEPI